MDSVEETLSLAAKTRNILILFTPAPENIVILAGKNESISSFCAMLSYCLSLY